MRRSLATLAILAVFGLGSSGAFAARAAEPVTILIEHDRDYAANRPGLDHTCYDDDHTYDFYAVGWLSPGESWSHDSPLAVCNDKIVKLHGWHAKRFALSFVLTDYGGHTVPARSATVGAQTDARSCNTDLGIAHVLADDPNDAGDIAYPVTWSITNTGDRAAYVELSGLVGEPPWQGGEGSYDGCLVP